MWDLLEIKKINREPEDWETRHRKKCVQMVEEGKKLGVQMLRYRIVFDKSPDLVARLDVLEKLEMEIPGATLYDYYRDDSVLMMCHPMCYIWYYFPPFENKG